MPRSTTRPQLWAICADCTRYVFQGGRCEYHYKVHIGMTYTPHYKAKKAEYQRAYRARKKALATAS